MEYIVPGSNDKSYNISYDNIKEYYECSCPDFKYRCSKNNEMCKHIVEVKTLDDCNSPDDEYKKRNIAKKTLTPVEVVETRLSVEDTDTTVSTEPLQSQPSLNDLMDMFNEMRVEMRERFDKNEANVQSLDVLVVDLSIHLGNFPGLGRFKTFNKK